MSQEAKLKEKQRISRNKRLYDKRSSRERQKDMREIDRLYSIESLFDD